MLHLFRASFPDAKAFKSKPGERMVAAAKEKPKKTDKDDKEKQKNKKVIALAESF